MMSRQLAEISSKIRAVETCPRLFNCMDSSPMQDLTGPRFISARHLYSPIVDANISFGGTFRDQQT